MVDTIITANGQNMTNLDDLRRRHMCWTAGETCYFLLSSNSTAQAKTLFKTTDGFSEIAVINRPDVSPNVTEVGDIGNSEEMTKVDMFYDGWAGHDGGLIHFVFWNTDDDEVQYQNLDTSDDCFSAIVTVASYDGDGTNIDPWSNTPSNNDRYAVTICRATGGTLCLLMKDHTNNYFWSSANDGATWVAGTAPSNSAGGWYELWPSGTGGTHCVLLEHDKGDDDFFIRTGVVTIVIAGVVHSASWGTRIQINDASNTFIQNVYSQHNITLCYGATFDPDNDRLWLVGQTKFNNAVADMDIFKIDVSTNPPTVDDRSDGSGSLARIWENQDESAHPYITLVQSTGDLYVWFQEAATLRTSGGGGDMFYMKSDDDGASWGSAVDISSEDGDIDYMIGCPLIETSVGGRVLIAWWADNTASGLVNDWVVNKSTSIAIAAAAAGISVPVAMHHYTKTIGA